MGFSRSIRVKERNRLKQWQNGEIGVDSDTLFVIRLPDPRTLRVLSRSVLLAMVILALPWAGSILKGLDSGLDHYASGNNVMDIEFLDLLLQDLANEGLIKKGDRALIIGAAMETYDSHFLSVKGIDFLMRPHLDKEGSFSSGTFDCVLAFGDEDVKFVDQIVKVGGVVVTYVSNDLSNSLQKQTNYRIMYIKQDNPIIVATRKISSMNHLADISPRRQLFQVGWEAKKVAFLGLEDPLLEPPRQALIKFKKFLKKFNYLPDLLGDSLEEYPRRVFVHVGLNKEKKAISSLFNKNYPTRNQEFEHYNVDLFPEGVSKSDADTPDVSNWLTQHVQEDDFVVMKAEATVAEAMIKQRTVGLIDELFLECSNQWQNAQRQKSKRAYWECLALYGKLKDEGVSVHQWWG